MSVNGMPVLNPQPHYDVFSAQEARARHGVPGRLGRDHPLQIPPNFLHFLPAERKKREYHHGVIIISLKFRAQSRNCVRRRQSESTACLVSRTVSFSHLLTGRHDWWDKFGAEKETTGRSASIGFD